MTLAVMVALWLHLTTRGAVGMTLADRCLV